MKKFSLICPTIRPKLIEKCYNRWASNEISFEMIFIGPIEPDKIPDNCVFIKTNVKPIQAWAYGFFIADSEKIMGISDDLLVSTGVDVLKVLSEEWEEAAQKTGYKTILSLSCSPLFHEQFVDGARFDLTGIDDKLSYHRRRDPIDAINFFHKSHTTPDFISPMCPIFAKKFYNEVGGPDVRFLAVKQM